MEGFLDVVFPPGGAFGEQGMVDRRIIWGRVAIFAAAFFSLWLFIYVMLLAFTKSNSLYGVGRQVWALKIMILFHHVISASWATWYIAKDPIMLQIFTFRGGAPEAQQMLVSHSSNQADCAMLLPFTIAYMGIDLALFPCWAKDPETVVFILHHLGSMYGWSEGLHFNWGPRYAVYNVSTELTGPFLVFRWILSQVGMKKSKLYIVNGLIFTLLFLLVRVCPIPALLRSMYLYNPHTSPLIVEPGLKEPTPYIRMVQPLAAMMIYIPLLLNMYWSVKVVKGAMSVVHGGKKEKKADKTK